MNKILKDILNKRVEQEKDNIVELKYDQSTIEQFYNELEKCLILDNIEHIDNPIESCKEVDGKYEYVVIFRKVFKLSNNITLLESLLAPYHITRLSTFGLYSDTKLSKEEIYKEIEEYIKSSNGEYSKDLDLELIKREDHDSIMVQTLSKL